MVFEIFDDGLTDETIQSDGPESNEQALADDHGEVAALWPTSKKQG